MRTKHRIKLAEVLFLMKTCGLFVYGSPKTVLMATLSSKSLTNRTVIAETRQTELLPSLAVKSPRRLCSDRFINYGEAETSPPLSVYGATIQSYVRIYTYKNMVETYPAIIDICSFNCLNLCFRRSLFQKLYLHISNSHGRQGQKIQRGWGWGSGQGEGAGV